jgi:uncharacterized membrane protein YphA (DoxX/SURF4 family)
MVARILLGLVFTVFGLNGFLNFLPPPELPEAAVPFMTGLASTGYFFPLLKLVEVVAGIFLLAGLFVPLALILLAPIVVNIAMFHFLLAPGEWWMGVLVVVLEIIVARGYWDSFSGVLEMRAKPSAG